jgi:tripartite-type tricarboxylate transporter receptor subunit TctC
MRAGCGFAAITAAIALSLGVASAQAQPYPTRSIKIVVPATPGGAIDVIARLVGDKLTASMGQPVVIENKPGASNNLGTDFVAKSPPDGYSLVIVASSHATNKFLFKQMPFDPVTDFEPVVFTHIVPLVLAVHPSIPAKNVQELIAWIKANPDKASFATSGKGSSLHMAAELFKGMAGIPKMLHVPYRGSSAKPAFPATTPTPGAASWRRPARPRMSSPSSTPRSTRRSRPKRYAPSCTPAESIFRAVRRETSPATSRARSRSGPR